MDNWDKSFAKGVCREEDGTPSYSRSAGGIVLLSEIVWVSLILYWKHGIPDAATMGGLATFAGVPYALNRVSAAISSLTQK